MTGRRSTTLRRVLHLAALAALGLLAAQLGATPFLSGVQRLNADAVLGALLLTALATTLSAWRWTVVSGILGHPLPLGTAVLAYMRSQLLNTLLPGGITGDVERGARAVPRSRRLAGVRAVLWDRAAAQAGQLAVLACALFLLDGRLRLAAALALAALSGPAFTVIVVARRVARNGRGRLGALAGDVLEDLRALTRRRGPLLVIAGTSTLVALIHAVVFVLASQVVGVRADLVVLIPLALLVQVAMAVPVGFGGLGAREGAAAAAFAVAGLGAGAGVTAAVADGALALIAVLPGLVPLLVSAARPTPSHPSEGDVANR